MVSPLAPVAQQTAVAPAPTQAPAPPQAPSPPIGPLGPSSFTIDGVPLTLDAVRSLRAQRSELSDQLVSAMGRRSDLAKEIETASAAQAPALQARLQQLDERILNIERQIEVTGQQIAQAPGEYLVQSERPNLGNFQNMRPDFTAISVVLTIFVLAPIAVSIARLVWRRGSNPPPQAIDRETTERLRRLESGVDAIALEVERISEGQRFVTKILAEREKSRLTAPRD